MASGSGTSQTISEALQELIVALPERERVSLIGLSGPQGAGKTTATNALKKVMGDDIAVLALDDFYLTRDERRDLASRVSPLFETRGVPGTHDIAKLESVISKLRTPTGFTPVRVPVFDKRIDDRKPHNDGQMIATQPKLIIVEGWCIGAKVPSGFEIDEPLNDIERHDADRAWRHHQKAQLETAYARLWSRFDAFIHIEPPSFDVVRDWRVQQEASNLGLTLNDLPKEKVEWVENFIQYYQRITEAMIAGNRQSGAIIKIDEERRVLEIG